MLCGGVGITLRFSLALGGVAIIDCFAALGNNVSVVILPAMTKLDKISSAMRQPIAAVLINSKVAYVCPEYKRVKDSTICYFLACRIIPE
jgi:hypothetical protein